MLTMKHLINRIIFNQRVFCFFFVYWLIEAERRNYIYIYASINPAIMKIMACCLFGSSHYLNQYWLIFTEPLWTNFNEIWILIQQFSHTNMGLNSCLFRLLSSGLISMIKFECGGTPQKLRSDPCGFVIHVYNNSTHLPWTKWPPFRRQYFQMHFLEWTKTTRTPAFWRYPPLSHDHP